MVGGTPTLRRARARPTAPRLALVCPGPCSCELPLRRDQENFQLIVITHDEAFAQSIGTREHADLLWRISKDEAQHSLISQEAIMD